MSTAACHYNRNKSPYTRPKVRVRCLGPGKEHTFWTDDRAKRRVCPRCRQLIDKMRLSPTAMDPVRASDP